MAGSQDEMDEVQAEVDRERWADFDWWPVQEAVMSKLRLRLARNKKIGSAITMAEGDELVMSLSTEIIVAVRTAVGAPS